MVKSVLMYAAEVWGARYVEQLEMAQVRYFKYMFLWPRNTPNYMVRQECGVSATSVELFRKMLGWWIKMLEMPEDRYPKICYNVLKEMEERSPLDTTHNWAAQLRERLLGLEYEQLYQEGTSRDIKNELENIIQKFEKKSKEEDMTRIQQSSYSTVYRELTEEGGGGTYLSYGMHMGKIRLASQLRIAADKCLRINVNGNYYKIDMDVVCSVCNMGKNEDLIHLLFQCPMYRETRAESTIAGSTHFTQNHHLSTRSTLSPLAAPFFPTVVTSQTHHYTTNYNVPIRLSRPSNPPDLATAISLSSPSNPRLPVPARNKLNKSKISSPPLTVLHHNVQSIRNKIPSIELFLNNLKSNDNLSPDVLCFTETWLSARLAPCYNIPGFVNLASFYRQRDQGGGVSIFIRDTMDLISLRNLPVAPIEYSFEYAAVATKTLDLAIVCVYRSNNPRSSYEVFLGELERLLSELKSYQYLVFCGDWNVDFLARSKQTLDLLSLFKSFNLHPLVSTPTRVTNTSATCLDNIFVSFPRNLILNDSTNIYSGLGDHGHAQLASFQVISQHTTNKVVTRTYSPNQVSSFLEALAKHPLNLINHAIISFYLFNPINHSAITIYLFNPINHSIITSYLFNPINHSIITLNLFNPINHSIITLYLFNPINHSIITLYLSNPINHSIITLYLFNPINHYIITLYLFNPINHSIITLYLFNPINHSIITLYLFNPTSH
ncbi:hypothetical protein M8J76_010400 [Diaphorina citri]|nr:hypothetical protein M8J76_010400 [Diaphorina citri]